MNPVLLIGLGVAGVLYMRQRRAPTGPAGAPAEAPTATTAVDPVEKIRRELNETAAKNKTVEKELDENKNIKLATDDPTRKWLEKQQSVRKAEAWKRGIRGLFRG